jgi:hypothetical protein
MKTLIKSKSNSSGNKTLLSMADCECRWQEPRGRLDLRESVKKQN